MSLKRTLTVGLLQGNDVNVTLSEIAQIPHAGKMEQVFPGDADPVRASLYTMDVPSEHAVTVCLALQKNTFGVKFAHYAAPRRAL